MGDGEEEQETCRGRARPPHDSFPSEGQGEQRTDRNERQGDRVGQAHAAQVDDAERNERRGERHRNGDDGEWHGFHAQWHKSEADIECGQ